MSSLPLDAAVRLKKHYGKPYSPKSSSDKDGDMDKSSANGIFDPGSIADAIIAKLGKKDERVEELSHDADSSMPESLDEAPNADSSSDKMLADIMSKLRKIKL